MAVRKEEADHLVQQDERLRIIDDEQFQETQRRLAGRRRGRRGPYLRSEARPFTGLIFCETCGSICYRRKSKNAKGEYHYYGCGCRHRHGDDACENAASIREDLLLQEVARTFKDLFEDADSIIGEATKEAQRLMRKNRGEVRRIGGQLAKVERKVGSLTRLLFDPDIGPAAKKAISRQIGEQEAERERLHKTTSELAEEANDGTELTITRIHLHGPVLDIRVTADTIDVTDHHPAAAPLLIGHGPTRTLNVAAP